MNRKDRKLDKFAKMAWDRLEKDNDAVVIAADNKHGKRMMRVAVGDRLVRETYIACHNNRPLSDKTDWKLGDLSGVFEVDVDVEQLLGTGLLIVLVGIAIDCRMAGRL